MAHYIYTKGGAAEAIGLRNAKALNNRIKRAKAAGCEPSKIIGGIEYFDMDLLLNPPTNDKYINNIKAFIEKQMKNRKGKKPLQLKLFDNF